MPVQIAVAHTAAVKNQVSGRAASRLHLSCSAASAESSLAAQRDRRRFWPSSRSVRDRCGDARRDGAGPARRFADRCGVLNSRHTIMVKTRVTSAWKPSSLQIIHELDVFVERWREYRWDARAVQSPVSRASPHFECAARFREPNPGIRSAWCDRPGPAFCRDCRLPASPNRECCRCTFIRAIRCAGVPPSPKRRSKTRRGWASAGFGVVGLRQEMVLLKKQSPVSQAPCVGRSRFISIEGTCVVLPITRAAI